MGLENGAFDCRNWSLRTVCQTESSRIAPAGGKQCETLYRCQAPVHTALSCRRGRRVYRGCVQSTRMVSGCDVRCRPRIRREVRACLGAGMAQRKQPSGGSGRDARSHSKELGVDRCGHRHRRLLYYRARSGRTLRGSRRALAEKPFVRRQGRPVPSAGPSCMCRLPSKSEFIASAGAAPMCLHRHLPRRLEDRIHTQALPVLDVERPVHPGNSPVPFHHECRARSPGATSHLLQ